MTADIRVYSAGLVVPITAPPIPHGAIAVRDGRILHVGERAWVVRELSARGAPFDEVHWPGVLLPGLVNAHSHLQYTGMAEIGRGRYAGFEDWGDAFDPAYDAGGQDWAAAAAEGARQMLAAGTTAVADIATDPEAVGALAAAGLHGITYWEVISWTNEEWARIGRREVETMLDALPTSPGAGLSPHAPYSLDVDPLLEIPDIVRRRGDRIHIHLGESAIERETAERAAGAWHASSLGSLREFRDAGFGMGATEFVDQLGILGPDCHVAHGVYLTARDRAILRARGTAVALCPRSNAVIGLDEPPVAAYLREGNAIAVGTDSLVSTTSLDLLGDVARLHAIARSQGYTDRSLAEQLLRAATLGGAHAMGLDTGPSRTGYLAVGARSDLTFLDLPVGGVEDTVEHIATGAEGHAAATVIAGVLRYASAAFRTTTGWSPDE